MSSAIRRTLRPTLGFIGVSSFVLALFLAGVTTSRGAVFTLTDANSVAQFDTADTVNHRGMFSWTVDGTQQLPGPSATVPGQWFFYRVGNTAESAIDTLPIATQGVSDTNFDGNNDTLFVKYANSGLTIQTRFTLAGGAALSGASDMAEQISITNTTASAMDFHFFQYADFDLEGTAAFDSALFTNANTVRQNEGSLRLTETVTTPPASHREIAFFPSTLSSLTDGSPTTLSDTPIGQLVGPGDVTWAFQWDVLLQPGVTFQISKDKNLSVVVPEPATWTLFAVGSLLMGAGWLGRKSRRSAR